jgi:hypothetical protein
MVKRLIKKIFSRNVAMTVLAVVVFVLLLGKYYKIDYSFAAETINTVKTQAIVFANNHGVLDSCATDKEMVVISRSEFVCVPTSAANLEFAAIYRSYPASNQGKESIYTFLESGSREKANELLQNVYDFDRWPASTLKTPLTWNENPYNERYWQFLFSSMRFTRNLLTAAKETGQERYYDKLEEIVNSFITDGLNNPSSWDDYHAAAFRTMVLINTWWDLRSAGKLTAEMSNNILRALVVHGEFLEDPDHYEDTNNHAVTQASALFLLGVNFPDLPRAAAWRELGKERINTSLLDLVDEDGVLVENTPYYHFYTLEKYWQIYRYSQEHNIPISDEFNHTIHNMVDYATYILRPDQTVPLLGASIPREIKNTGEFSEIAKERPDFRYVMTAGASGEEPAQRSILFPSSGQWVARSVWGKGSTFRNATQLVFDAGPYRTDHSDLDVLTFTLFSRGQEIIRDTGLYTYEEANRYFDYFHGTAGHNTVMVDGKDQPEGEGVIGEMPQGKNYLTESAYHTLYPGVTHRRGLLLFGDSALLVVDSLESDTSHQYQQIFHLAPPATIDDVRGKDEIVGNVNGVSFSLHQLASEDIDRVDTDLGDQDKIAGLCATAYEKMAPCEQITYTSTGSTAHFVTLISLGGDVDYNYDENAQELRLTTPTETYNVHINYPALGSSDQVSFTVDESSHGKKGIIDRLKSLF